jgi:uncharacterized protein Smg (DUF494 family)
MSAVLAMTEEFGIKTDWAKLLDELRDAGFSGYAVAKALGRNWDTVQGWREHEPRHSDGEALKAFHRKHCRRLEA